MKTKSVFFAKGISASGKGTRVSQLQEFLKTKYTYKIAYYKTTDILLPVGVYFEDLKVMMLGKWVKSNKSKLYGWTSLDYFHSMKSNDKIGNPGGHHILRYSIGKFSNENLIMEGYPLTLCKAYHVPTLYKDFGFTSYLFQYYTYPEGVKGTKENLGTGGFELMQERVQGRSGLGKRIQGTCWNSHKATIKEYERHEKLIEDAGEDVSSNVEYTGELLSYDEPITRVGSSYLKFLGLDTEVKEFEEYSVHNTTLRHVTNLEENKRFENHLTKPILLKDISNLDDYFVINLEES